jgi:hypothetical protein
LAQSAHSIEEILTGLWRWMPVVSGTIHQHLSFVPRVSMSEMTFVVGNLVVVTLVLALSPFVFLERRGALTLASAVAVVETVNGLNHLGGALAVHGYFSGCISAVGLLLFSVPFWGRKWIFRSRVA